MSGDLDPGVPGLVAFMGLVLGYGWRMEPDDVYESSWNVSMSHPAPAVVYTTRRD